MQVFFELFKEEEQLVKRQCESKDWSHEGPRRAREQEKVKNSTHRTGDGRHTVDGLAVACLQEVLLKQEVATARCRLCDRLSLGHLQVVAGATVVTISQFLAYKYPVLPRGYDKFTLVKSTLNTF